MDLTFLWELQNLYLEKQALEQSLKSREAKELYGEKEQILANLAALKKRDEELDQKRRNLKQQENRIADLTSKWKEAEEHLYSGEVTNSKELESIEQQVKQLKQELTSCEDNFLIQSEKLELATSEYEERKNLSRKQKQEYNSKVAKYLTKKKQLKNSLEKINKEIKNFKEIIEPKLLTLYENKKQKYGLTVLSKIEGKTCSACHMIIPTLILKEAKKGQGLVNCENCGRILYWE